MFNPLLPDLSTLKNEDIDLKITELMQKYFIAARFGQSGVCEQISVIIEAYKEEQKKRQLKANQALSNKNRNFDDLINVDT
jgi:hypothetical protein